MHDHYKVIARHLGPRGDPSDGGICLRVDDRAELLIDGRTPEKVNLVNDYYLLDAVKDADVIIFAGKISSPAATSCVVSGSLNVD